MTGLGDWRDGLGPLEGERHSVKHGRLSMVISCDDYREDAHYIDPDQAALLEEIEAQSTLDLKDVARVALDTMWDVSCSSIATALGLKLHVVIGLSNGRHNKAKRKGASKGIELAEITYDDLIENYRAQVGA